MEHTFLETWKFGSKILNFIKRQRSEKDKTVLTKGHILTFVHQAFYTVFQFPSLLPSNILTFIRQAFYTVFQFPSLTAFYALFRLPSLQPSSGVLRWTKHTISLAVQYVSTSVWYVFYMVFHLSPFLSCL
jgi:hypothetical protein